MVLNQFPYNTTETEQINDTELDSLQLAQIEKDFQLKQEQDAVANWDMIKNDFPTLSDLEITENIELIDEYYAQNLDYLALDAIANNEKAIMSKINTKNTHKKGDLGEFGDFGSCFISLISTAGGFNIVKTLYAANKAKDAAESTIKHFFTSANGVKIEGGNSANNTYKHMVFSAFLAQWYFTVSSKSKRLDFAKVVATSHEYCNPNEPDSREMDFHNNAIGRKIWDDNTSYRKLFGRPVGLNRPSDSKLREEIRKRISNSSCFIVKIVENRFPENRQKRDLTIPETKSKILATPSHIPVYFTGPILESQYKWKRVKTGTESYDCNAGNSTSGGFGDLTPRTTKCTRPVYEWVNTEIIPCFKL